MGIDPLRLAIAVVPLTAYGLVIGWINARRRPFLTSGGCDLAALGVAISGLVFVGPLELFRPEAATRSFGDFIWLFLLLFYWLTLLLTALLSRPRLVVYNTRIEELHPILAEVASRLDPSARWAGNQLALPTLGVQLHFDSVDLMRNVSLVASGPRQNLDSWRRISRELSDSLVKVRVRPNPRAIGFLAASTGLLLVVLWLLVSRPDAVGESLRTMFAF
ncbi:MAG: hypothetical protein U0805_10690 [Pirellulales bacterium]